MVHFLDFVKKMNSGSSRKGRISWVGDYTPEHKSLMVAKLKSCAKKHELHKDYQTYTASCTLLGFHQYSVASRTFDAKDQLVFMKGYLATIGSDHSN